MSGPDRRKVGNLPIDLSSFIGRRRELGEVRRRLTEARLVTLTGVGGTGKTRLALRVAAEVQRAFPHGVWFVDLTQLREPRLLTQEVTDPDVLAYLVMASLGLHQRGDGPSVQQLITYLSGRQALLVLDNCEHLLPTCAVLADTLLRGCPTLRVLATSREPLAIGGEVLWPVPPLPTPDPNQRQRPADLARSEAVALFVARAQAVMPGFALTKDNAEAVAQLCRRLDGLPLAIELAAARVRVLDPEQILGRLGDRFALLSRGSRAAPARQQTLRACVEWSFDLCAKPERVLWARLSVFVGGFELDAVEVVCSDECLPVDDLVDVLAGLVDKSILDRADGRDSAGGQVRYRMLEAIRDYGQEQLVEAGEQIMLRRRHRDWYQQLAAQAHTEFISHRQVYWHDRLAREHPNLRTAIEFCLTVPGEAAAALAILVDLPQGFWSSHGVVRQGEGWLDGALARVTAPTVLRARALVLYGSLAVFHGDTDTMERWLDEGERLAQRLHDHVALARAAYVRAAAALLGNNLTGAIESAEQGLAILPDASEPELVLLLLLQVVWAAGLIGDDDRARRCHQEILAITEPRGETRFRSWALWGLALLAWRGGAAEEADQHVRESLRAKQRARSNDPYGAALGLELLAWISARQQRHRRAATLLGAADTPLTDRGTPITTHHHLIGDHDACERQTRAALGGAAFTEAFRHGQALALDDALAYALDERAQPAGVPPKGSATPLTRRERQVAALLAEGLSNKDIAGRLVISQRTAESHVEHILIKLGFTSRVQIAAWITEQHSDTSNTQYRNT
jgi:predicted ATPase/DNA-binding NarL/FixJ family response regulator